MRKTKILTSLRYGKLDNGMTYYIKQNMIPEKRAEFYIIHNVGAILENDKEDGLAHFSEHMAFNGTKNYPKKGVLNFLEEIGVKFGHNVNAFTATDVTAYNLSNVPVTREGIIDSSLLILHDWSSYVSFENEEIDAERGVIHEEWRTRRTANFRTNKALAPILYKGSKYAKRDVIGKLDVIDNCKYETMRGFYKKWYRPDLQAIVIVGDINPEEIEAKVTELFSDIPQKQNAPARPVFEIPNNNEPLVGIATDKESQNTRIALYYKHDIVPAENKNLSYVYDKTMHQLYNNMINKRLSELTQKENPPFIYAYSQYGSMVRSKDSYLSIVGAKNSDIPAGINAIVTENERVKRHGFTTTEFERTKTELLRNLEKQYIDREKQKNSSYVWKCFSHFLTNEPFTGIEYKYFFVKDQLPNIKLSEINTLAKKWITDKNMVVTVTGPEKDGINIPTKEEILNIISKVKQSDIKPYIDKVSKEPLMAKIPTAGKVISENKNNKIETTEWELSNGLKVIIKETNFKEDEILFSGFSFGGSSVLPVEDIPSAMMTGTIMNMSGIGKFNDIELQKMLSGKIVSIHPYLADNTEGFSGSSSPEDFETLLQLTNLYFTNHRFDETAYNAYMSRINAYMANKASDPNSIFRDSVSYILTNRNPRKQPLNTELLSKVKFETIKNIYLDRFKDASDFTFIFTGKINAEKAKPLIETYLGSIPSINRKESWKDNNVRPPKGIVKKKILKDLEVAKSSVFVDFNGKMIYDYYNRLMLKTITHILQLRYTETIREEEGGSYGVGVWNSTNEYPVESYKLNMQFDCDPEKQEMFTEIIYKEIE
jgi:zinc protease